VFVTQSKLWASEGFFSRGKQQWIFPGVAKTFFQGVKSGEFYFTHSNQPFFAKILIKKCEISKSRGTKPPFRPEKVQRRGELQASSSELHTKKYKQLFEEGCFKKNEKKSFNDW